MTMDLRFSPIADNDLFLGNSNLNCHAEMTSRPRKQHIIPCDNGYKIDDLNFDNVNIKLKAPEIDALSNELFYTGNNIDINLSEIGKIKAEKHLNFNDLILEKRGGELHVFSELKVVYHGLFNGNHI